MTPLKYFSIVFLGIMTVFALQSTHVSAFDVPPVPSDIPIVDQTNTLTADQKNQLSTVIATERAASGNQIAVLIVPSLKGEPIESYSIKVAREWGIGENERNNGVLLLVALQDRQLRIEVGYGLEGALPDAQAARIIRDDITPHFRQDRYYEGIAAGVDAIIASIHNEYVAQDPSSPLDAESLASFPLAMLLIFPIWIASILARTKSWWAGGVIGGLIAGLAGWILSSALLLIIAAVLLVPLGLLFDWAVSKNYRKHVASGGSPSWWAGGSHLGGGHSGGFGGFGGGGFGGGGASGRW